MAPVFQATWFASVALLNLCVLRVWHILLLKLHLDAPLVLAGYLSAVFALVLLSRTVATRMSLEVQGRGQRLFRRLDATGLTFITFFLVLTFVFHWGFERAASDGREYFVQVRSLHASAPPGPVVVGLVLAVEEEIQPASPCPFCHGIGLVGESA